MIEDTVVRLLADLGRSTMDCVVRRADDLTGPIVDTVDDGLTEAEIAARVESWLDELLAADAVELGVSAVDELAEARRLGEV